MGAGYEASTSNSRAIASSANQHADTVFNFSSPGSWFGGDTQTSSPTASSTAATKSPGAGSEAVGAATNAGGPKWPLYAALAAAAAVILFLVLKR